MAFSLRTAALAGLGVGVLAAGTLYLVLSGGAEQVAAPPPTPSASATPSTSVPSPTASSSSPVSPTPTSSPSPTPAAVEQRSAEEAVAAFVEAWLTTGEDRAAALGDTATPHLAELLADTDPAEIPRATPNGSPTEVALPAGQRPTHAEEARRYSHDLTDGSTVLVDVVPDPERGWLAVAIRPAT